MIKLLFSVKGYRFIGKYFSAKDVVPGFVWKYYRYLLLYIGAEFWPVFPSC